MSVSFTRMVSTMSGAAEAIAMTGAAETLISGTGAKKSQCCGVITCGKELIKNWKQHIKQRTILVLVTARIAVTYPHHRVGLRLRLVLGTQIIGRSG